MKTQSRRVLLVESEEVLAEVTRFRLELLGYEMFAFQSGEAAWAWLLETEELPQAVVVDLTLPDMSGLELIERITCDQRSAGIPIMALSHEADLDAVQGAFQAGVMDYLLAPYDPVVLEKKVEELVTRGQSGAVAAGAKKAVR